MDIRPHGGSLPDGYWGDMGAGRNLALVRTLIVMATDGIVSKYLERNWGSARLQASQGQGDNDWC